MELSQLEAFLEAVERGSFRRAAEALFLAQPSVSTRIQRLEDELGVPLFHRTARGVRLTDMGRTFLPFAQRSMESLRRGKKWLRKSEQGDKWNRCLIEGMIVPSETGARDEQTTPP